MSLWLLCCCELPAKGRNRLFIGELLSLLIRSWMDVVPGIAVTPTELVVVKDGIIAVYDDSTGALRWSWEAPSGQQLITNPVVSSQYIFAATATTTYAIDRRSREVVWSTAQSGKLALDGAGTLYILSAATLTSISLTWNDAP